MQIKTNKTDLLQILNAAFKAVPTKASFPMMENFLLAVDDGTMYATATDGGMTIVASESAEGEGKTCINARMLLDAVTLLPDGDISITTDDKSAVIDYGKGKFSIPCFDTEDFPTVTIAITYEGVTVDKELLKTALGYVAPSIAKDVMRPQLCGVYFNPSKNGGYDLVATESRTLSLENIECEGNVGDFILSANAVNFLKSMLKGEGNVLFHTDEKSVTFQFDKVLLNVTKIVGKFPNYEQVMPDITKTHQSTLTTKTEDFLGAIKRVATCSNKASNSIKFDLNQLNGANIEAQDIGFGCAAKEEATYVKYEGEEMSIGFKHDLLTALIAATDADEVTLHIDNPKKAVLITTANEKRKAIIMPVAIA